MIKPKITVVVFNSRQEARDRFDDFYKEESNTNPNFDKIVKLSMCVNYKCGSRTYFIAAEDAGEFGLLGGLQPNNLVWLADSRDNYDYAANRARYFGWKPYGN
jgi:hypothetical protein